MATLIDRKKIKCQNGVKLQENAIIEFQLMRLEESTSVHELQVRLKSCGGTCNLDHNIEVGEFLKKGDLAVDVVDLIADQDCCFRPKQMIEKFLAPHVQVVVEKGRADLGIVVHIDLGLNNMHPGANYGGIARVKLDNPFCNAFQISGN